MHFSVSSSLCFLHGVVLCSLFIQTTARYYHPTTNILYGARDPTITRLQRNGFGFYNHGFLSFELNCPTPEKASKKKSSGKTKKRAQRATSNVFAMFDQAQIQEFKEAFNLIDQNHDGFIDKEDLHDMLASMGKNPSDKELEDMVKEVPGSINFTMFLTMFGEKLTGTDPEETIINAFKLFDEENKGFISEDYLTNLLKTRGDHFTDDEVDQAYRGAPIDDEGNLDYESFVRIIKHGTKDESLVKTDA